MRRSIALLTLAAAFATLPVAAQESVTGLSRRTVTVDRRLDSRFPATVSERLANVIAAAVADSLPEEPLVLRALEGGAKRIPPDRIEEALVRLHRAMLTARKAIGFHRDDTELTTAAAAVQAGLSGDRLAELRRLRSGHTLSVPLATWLELVARGADPDRAWSRIDALARRDAPDRDYARIEAADVMRPPRD